MTQALKMSLTCALWLANAFFWLLLAGVAGFQLQQIFFNGDMPAPRLEPVAATVLTPTAFPPIVLAGIQPRNPFDPAGAPWQVAGSPAPTEAPGQVRGIVVLPGVGVAMTDRGPVKPGAVLHAGRLISVKTTGAMVATPTGPQALALPGSKRPSLQDLNQARPPVASSNVR